MLGVILVMALGLAFFAAVRMSLIDPTPSFVSGGDTAGPVAAPLSSSPDADETTRTRDVVEPSADDKAAKLARQADRAREAREARRVEQLAKARDRSLARLAARVAQAQARASQPFTVRVGSFNVLGSQHTAPGGDRRRFPPASVRSPGAADLIARHGVDIVGTQELQSDQLAALQSRTGMSAFPGNAWGSAETDNSILYDPNRFEYVDGDSFTIPFMGRPRPQPILKLRELATGREFYVVNTHPSAGGGRYLSERRSGQSTLVGVVNQLRATGLPVLVTGDMNDRELFYCNVMPQTGMTAPHGGSYASGCQPPPQPIPVDWVVGGGPISWSSYWRDTTAVSRRISDHMFISATAQIS